MNKLKDKPQDEDLDAVNKDDDLSENKTILLVEDEQIVREMVHQILKMSGFKVKVAENGIKALEICKSTEVDFDLLITDVTMPQMNGRELAENVLSIYPKIKVLYMSGYIDDENLRNNLRSSNQFFISKPFSTIKFVNMVQEILSDK